MKYHNIFKSPLLYIYMVKYYIIFLENFLLYSLDFIDPRKYGLNSYNYDIELESESCVLPHDLDDEYFLRGYNLYHGN